MPRVAVGWCEEFAEYRAPEGHPERAERAHAVGSAITALGGHVERYPFESATDAQLIAIHHPRYLAALAATAGSAEPVELDADTVATAHAYRVARLAAGAAIGAVDAVLAGGVTRAFSLARPPGHHAEVDRAMGFCFFNNIAIAAQHALDAHGLSRIAIVDWDVHHGNGTQRAFENRSDVLFVSSHQVKLFPGTGQHREQGRGRGRGFTLNLPLSHEASDEELIALHRHITLPVLARFAPELVMISAGFDAHEKDPSAGQRVTSEGFARLAALLFDTADQTCAGRVVLVLEGGYDLEALRESIVNVLHAALDPGPWRVAAPTPRGKLELVIQALAALHAPYWPVLGASLDEH
jgi:acetoin utilization deacetylase AcuC-like enzyme